MDLFAPRHIDPANSGDYMHARARMPPFWWDEASSFRVRKPRTRTPEQIAKHAAKLHGRRRRWVTGLAHNRCISVPKFLAITKHITI